MQWDVSVGSVGDQQLDPCDWSLASPVTTKLSFPAMSSPLAVVNLKGVRCPIPQPPTPAPGKKTLIQMLRPRLPMSETTMRVLLVVVEGGAQTSGRDNPSTYRI